MAAHLVALTAMVAALTAVSIFLLYKVFSLQGQIWRSPPRERYTRASVVVGKTQVDAGLEWRDGDPPIVGHDLWQLCKEAAQRAHFVVPMQALLDAEPALDSKWPGRAWFLEIGDVDGTSYSQTYQPWGRPRWRYDNEKRWWQVWRSDERNAA